MLTIRLLGGFQASYNHEPVAGLEAARLQSFLAYLILHRQAPQLRQHIAFLFWPDSTESQARTNLRGLLHALSKALPASETFLEVEHQTIKWRAESPYLLDVDEYRRALEVAQSTSALREAIDLYRGELLPGFYEDWILAERERLRAEFFEGLDRLVALLEVERDDRSAVRYVRMLLREEPYQEKNYRRLMHLYVRIGDRASALSVYQSCVQILRNELAVEVSPDTQSLYEEIVRGETSAPPAISSPPLTRMDNLPIQLTSFIGREHQLTQVRESLLAGRLLTITGPGGSGKTRLALQAADAVAEAFSDGVWLVELAPLSAPADVPGAVASVLKVRDQPNRPLLDDLVEFLRNKTMLLLLDNCEHLLQTLAELIVTILQTCPQLRILATSRERLYVPGERVHLVMPLGLPPSGKAGLAKIKAAEAVQLFMQGATAILPTFILDESNAPVVAQICHRLEGIPLAIELAAARVRLFSPAEIVERLDDTFRLLSGGSQVTPPRHHTLRATMDWSYVLLSEEERILLRRLSVFAGGWTLSAAEFVTTAVGEEPAAGFGSTTLAKENVLENLARLIDKSLVLVDSQSGIARYRMLETIREYSLEKLTEAGEVPLIHEGHFNYFLDFAADAEQQLEGPNQISWLNRLVEEGDNLRAGFNWALEVGRSEQALRLAQALHNYWLNADRVMEGSEWIQEALSKTGEAIDPQLLARALHCLGYLIYLQGDFSTADKHAQRSQKLFEELEDKDGIAHTVLTQGIIFWHQGKYEGAQSRFEQSLSLFREARDITGVAEALHHLGHLSLDQGNHVAARAYFEESIELFRDYGDRLSVAALLGDLGVLAYLQEQFAAARSYYEENLTFFREVGNRDGIARTLIRLGDLARCEGNYDKAETFYNESLRLARMLELESYRLSALHNLGYVALNQQELQQSASLFAQGLRAYGDLEDKKGVAECLAGLAAVASVTGQLERAARLFGASHSLLDSLGTEPWPANRIEIDRCLLLLRKGMDDEIFILARETGRQMDLSEAVADAIDLERT